MSSIENNELASVIKGQELINKINSQTLGKHRCEELITELNDVLSHINATLVRYNIITNAKNGYRSEYEKEMILETINTYNTLEKILKTEIKKPSKDNKKLNLTYKRTSLSDELIENINASTSCEYMNTELIFELKHTLEYLINNANYYSKLDKVTCHMVPYIKEEKIILENLSSYIYEVLKCEYRKPHNFETKEDNNLTKTLTK